MRWPWSRSTLMASAPHQGKDGRWHFEVRAHAGMLKAVSPPGGYPTREDADQAIADLSASRILPAQFRALAP